MLVFLYSLSYQSLHEEDVEEAEHEEEVEEAEQLGTRTYKQIIQEAHIQHSAEITPEDNNLSTRINVMNDMVTDVQERIIAEAHRLANTRKRAKITTRDLNTAVKLIMTESLATAANKEAQKTVKTYKSLK